VVKQHRFHRFVFCFKHFAQLSNIFDLMRTELGLNLLSMTAQISFDRFTVCGPVLP
jgi:hypothetical protein